jgi:hypothetical protein
MSEKGPKINAITAAVIGGEDAFAALEGAAPTKPRSVVSLFDFAQTAESVELPLLRITENETGIIPFTADVESVQVHYVDAPEIGGFVRCNGTDCLLCQLGRKADQRLLSPAYDPMTGSIAVLSITPSMRPHALLPQLVPHLKTAERSVLFIKRLDLVKHRVTARPLRADEDDGRAVIKAFEARWDRGEVRLGDVYNQMGNDALLLVPSLAAMAKLKGLTN